MNDIWGVGNRKERTRGKCFIGFKEAKWLWGVGK